MTLPVTCSWRTQLNIHMGRLRAKGNSRPEAEVATCAAKRTVNSRSGPEPDIVGDSAFVDRPPFRRALWFAASSVTPLEKVAQRK